MTQSQQNVTKSKKVVKVASGRNAPKVRTGCRTCKLRKVKCDEGRPACNRCITSGRTCDGYGIWGGGDNAANHTEMPSASPDRPVNLQPKVRISRKETKVPIRVASTSSGSSQSPMTEPSSPDTVGSEDRAQIVQSRRFRDSPEQSSSPESYQCITRSIPPLIVEIPKTIQESNLLCWYQEITSSKLTGAFISEFWTSLLLQASYSEPAVLHGVLALTSAHKNELLQPLLPGEASEDEQFTLQAYSKAIRYLKPHFRDQTNASRKVTLIACILFVCLEMVQKRHATAVSHLSSGLKLIAQSERARGETGDQRPPNDYTSDLIDQAFLKLSVQVSLLGYSNFHPGFILNRRTSSVVPSRFFSVEEAKEHLDKLMFRALEMSDICRKQDLSQQAQDLSPEERAALQRDLQSWFETFTVSGVETNPSLPPKSKAGTVILRMYHAMAVIMTEICQHPRQETLYDSQTSRFATIMMYATKMWRIVAGWHANFGSHFPGDEKGSIIDIGWIPAVYYTAIKCRVRRLRLQAIQLLEATLHTEGIWDAATAAPVAREVMRIEEGPEQELSGDDIFLVGDVLEEEQLIQPSLPETKRVHDVEVTYPSDGHGGVEMICRRRLESGEWEETHRTYDPVMGTWTDSR